MQGLTMAQMATRFANGWVVWRPVLNRTGLAGRWDGEINFVPAFLPGPNPNSAPVANPAADSGPNIPSAIRDQLGLKLDSAKAPVEVLVIDHVERPTPD
jgi:bla regulator protein blaR1